MNKAAAIAAEIPRLRRYARALLGDSAEADDLVQECLARALARKEQWRQGTSPRKWLFTILHNLHIDEIRRRKRWPQQVAMEDSPVSAESADPPRAERGFEIQEALGRLSVEQRQVLLMVALEGLSYAETAEVLEVPIGTVMSRVSRARERLRREIYGDPGSGKRLKRVK